MEPSGQPERRLPPDLGTRLLPWVLGGGLLAGLYLLGAPVCPSRRVLGLPCPGCGMTRAGIDLLLLDPGAAFHHHPMVFVVAPLLGWVATSAVLDPSRVRMPRAWIWVVTGVALIGVWALRLAGLLGGHPDF